MNAYCIFTSLRSRQTKGPVIIYIEGGGRKEGGGSRLFQRGGG